MDKFEALLLLAYARKPKVIPEGKRFQSSDNKNKYKLPSIYLWDEEYCDALQKIPYSRDLPLALLTHKDKLEQFPTPQKVSDNSKSVLEKAFSSIKTQERSYNFFTCDYLPVDFIRFHPMIILREPTEEIAQKCAESIWKGSSFYTRSKNEMDQIFQKPHNRRNMKRDLETIYKACALESHFNTGGELKLAQNNPIYELLQNANDKVTDGVVHITLTNSQFTLAYNEKSGFSSRDFFTVSSIRRSGNVNDDTMETTIGHKGTGFKSVYNYFDVVKIISKGWQCTLDHTKTVVIDFDQAGDDLHSDCIGFRSYGDSEKKTGYPVPVFIKNPEKFPCTTTIQLEFSPDKSRDSFQIFDSNFFEKTKCYFFLENIHTFVINGVKLDKKKYLEEYFYSYSLPYTSPSEYSEKYKFSYGMKNLTREGKIIPDENKRVQVLFPKNVNTPMNQCNLYVGLPVKDYHEFSGKFYVNTKLLDLTDDRNGVLPSTAENPYNSTVFGYIYECFRDIFEKFAKDHDDIVFLYFPFHLTKLRHFLIDTAAVDSIDKDLIRELKSIQDLKVGHAVLLPDFMYQWFRKTDNLEVALREFHSPIPVVIYEKSEIAEPERQLREWIRPWYSGIDNLLPQIKRTISLYFENIFYENHAENKKNRWILKVLSESPHFKTEYQSLYRWYLGKDICAKQPHYHIDYFGDDFGKVRNDNGQLIYISLGNYRHIGWYKAELTKFYGVLDDGSYQACFNKSTLRTKLYVTYDDELAIPEDTFVRDVFEKLKEYPYELKSLVSKCQHELYHLEKKDIVPLYQAGLILLSVDGNEYKPSNHIHYYSQRYRSTSIAISESIIQSVKQCMRDLDVQMKHGEIWTVKYQTEQERNAIFSYYALVKHSNQKNWLWQKEFLPYLDLYREITEDKVKFSFKLKDLTTMPEKMKDRIQLKIPEDILTKEHFLMGVKRSLKEYLYESLRISDEGDGKSRWVLGCDIINGVERDVIVIFGERSLNAMLKDLFVCDYYGREQRATMVDTDLPMAELKPHYDSVNALPLTALSVKDYEQKAVLKDFLIQNYECKSGGRWFCFAGYGNHGKNFVTCPVCGGTVVSHASSLHVQRVPVKIVEQELKRTVPIVLCSNCNDAFLYDFQIALKFTELKDFYEGSNAQLIYQREVYGKAHQFDMALSYHHRCLLLGYLQKELEQLKQPE